MRITFRIGKRRFTFMTAKVTDVHGVNSHVTRGLHLCMWDFDNKSLIAVIDELRRTQDMYRLPRIFILQTSRGMNYQAFCFTRRPWEQVIAIVGQTFFVDANFFKLGVLRGHFTLRTSPKFGYKPELVHVLASLIPDECTPKQLRHWSRYETVDHRGKKSAVIRI